MNTTLGSPELPNFLKLLTHELRWKILTALARSDYSVQEIVRFLDRLAGERMREAPSLLARGPLASFTIPRYLEEPTFQAAMRVE